MNDKYTNPKLTFPKLLLAIGMAVIAFWLLGYVVKIAQWLLQLSLVVGLVLVIVGLVNMYIQSMRKNKSASHKKTSSRK